MKSAVKAFFGGGSTYFYLLIGGVFVGMYGYINFLEARLDTVKTQRDAAIQLAENHGSIADSQNRNNQAEVEAKKDADDAKDEIANSPNPIAYAYDWVRERREQQRNTNE